MKILHIIDTLLMGGAENVLIGLTEGQKQLGHEVTIMPLVCPKKTPVRSRIEDNGVKVVPLQEKGSVYNPYLIIKIARIIGQYDIIHVHLFPALYWAALAKFISFSKVSMVYTEHSTNNKRRSNFILHHTDRLVYKYGYKMVVACAEKVLESFTFAFPRIQHVCYINNGIDTEKFRNALPYSKRELLGVDDNTFLVTMVARFMPMKRQDTIVDALVYLPDNIHAVFVGGNEEDNGLVRVKKMAEEKGVAQRVHFLYVRTDVPSILKTSDVVILASDYEGLSLSSIEGMAAGKPFIATNVNGLKEVVEGAGLLFENRDAKSLAQHINRLATDIEFYNVVANKCEARSKEYDVKKMVESYIEVYNNI